MKKKDKNLNVPNLRFPEFSGEWERSNLKRFATKITKKNKGNMCSNVLSNSANYGIIPQSDFFDRSIANSDNTDTYYVIEGGDFVYNPRKSTAAPYGPINVYEGTEVGIISPLYLCFKVEWINKKYLYHYFKSNKWHPYMYINGDSGARHDRVSIKDDVFLDMPLFVPSQKEQLKITLLLDAIDKRIETQKKIIEKYESLIRGLCEQLTRQGTKNKAINECLDCHASTLQESTVSGTGEYPVYGATGVCGYTNFNDVKADGILIIKDGASVGTTYYARGSYSHIGTLNRLTARKGVNLRYVYYCLKVMNFAPYKTGLAIPHIYFKDYGKHRIWCPSYEEQLHIANILTQIDDKIHVEKSLLEQLNSQKRYMLNQLFI